MGETLRELIPRLEKQQDSSFKDAIVEHHESKVAHLQTYVEHEGSGQGLRPEMVATALSDLADEDAALLLDLDALEDLDLMANLDLLEAMVDLGMTDGA